MIRFLTAVMMLAAAWCSAAANETFARLAATYGSSHQHISHQTLKEIPQLPPFSKEMKEQLHSIDVLNGTGEECAKAALTELPGCTPGMTLLHDSDSDSEHVAIYGCTAGDDRYSDILVITIDKSDSEVTAVLLGGDLDLADVMAVTR